MQDYENVDDVNRQLERMGYNIGVRIIEDFLARTGSARCNDFRDTSEKVLTILILYQNHELDNSMISNHVLTLNYLGAAGVQDFLECDPHCHKLVIGKRQVKKNELIFIRRQVTSSR